MSGKDLLKTLFEYAEILIHPSCWLRNYKYNAYLDRRINTLIECRYMYDVYRGGCWLYFKDKATRTIWGFWIENNYYASLSRGYYKLPSDTERHIVLFNQMPSRRTVLRFFRTFKDVIQDKPRDTGAIEDFFKGMK